MTPRRRRIVRGLAATAALPLTLGALAPVALACHKGQSGAPHGKDQLTICHATGSETNPYVLIHPATAGVMHGHLGEHHHGARDIIPEFTFRGRTYSQNWDDAGEAVLANGCVPVPDDPELLTPPADPPAAEEPPAEEPPPAEPPAAEEPPAEPPAPQEPPLDEPLPPPDQPSPGTFGY
jgi:hypothetical protein